MKMAAMNQDSATGDEAGGDTRRIKDYCDQAVANLKAGRLKEAYLYANEALEVDEKDVKADALHRHALYALHPKKRLLDKTTALHEEAHRCKKARDNDKALELLSLAKKWHCTPGILDARSNLNAGRIRYDLAYVDMTEGLAQCKKDRGLFAAGQRICLSFLGYKVLPVIESDPHPRPDEMPARYHASNWPKGLGIDGLSVHLLEGYAEAMKTDGTLLKPHIPLDQLAQFLNNHVQGLMQPVLFFGKDRREGMLLRLLDEVIVPGRLHVDYLNFTDFFFLSWADIKRILDGRTLRSKTLVFSYLQLPSGVDANELLKLPTVRRCTGLQFLLYSFKFPQLPGRPPLFNNAALLEWIKRSDGRCLHLAREYLSSGLLSFLDTLKKVGLAVGVRQSGRGPVPNQSRSRAFQDFLQATQVHSYDVAIQCPHIDVSAGLGVRDEQLSNRLGEKMQVIVGEDRTATLMMGHRFETVGLKRLSPS